MRVEVTVTAKMYRFQGDKEPVAIAQRTMEQTAGFDGIESDNVEGAYRRAQEKARTQVWSMLKHTVGRFYD